MCWKSSSGRWINDSYYLLVEKFMTDSARKPVRFGTPEVIRIRKRWKK